MYDVSFYKINNIKIRERFRKLYSTCILVLLFGVVVKVVGEGAMWQFRDFCKETLGLFCADPILFQTSGMDQLCEPITQEGDTSGESVFKKEQSSA